MEANRGTIPEDLLKVENALSNSLKNLLTVRDAYGDRTPPSHRGDEVRRLAKRLGARYLNASFGNYEIYHEKQQAVFDRLMEFARKMPEHLAGSGGLMLFGDPGTGKDHLLAALLKVAIGGHGLTVEWFDGGSLFDAFYSAIKSDDDGLKDLTKSLCKPHILAISDPQPPAGELSDSQIRRLRDVIDRRYRAGLSTWITTNIDNREDAERLLTAPLMQRIKEGSAKILCDWPTYRERVKASW